ncbi:MAG: tyrosyl-tRNA synthetase [Bradyrhizobium sp.]|nr:tyrosyl-tRNA synthetase [Bradyrhizobium sp.]
MPDNAEWLTKLNWIEMLRDIGRHFSVNRMLAMDSVKLRLERDQEMSFIEFNYMILQAYDYAVLNQRYDCRLQMGGSDQWGNIVNGIDLGRRMGTPQLHAMTTPLITTAGGAKMGKTASGAVWLNADMKSPYEYWQFWRNTDSNASKRMTEKCRPRSRSISIQFSLVSHSALSGMTASDLPSPNFRNRENTCLMPSLLRSISSIDRILRVSSLPEGSPTRVVPPPISAIGLLPVCCSQYRHMIWTIEPTCSDGAVQSKPI